jgi:hypothetical protein
MKEQFDILNALASLIYAEAPQSCDEIIYKAETEVEEGWVESSYSYRKDGVQYSVHLSDACEAKVSELVVKLNDVMYEHTGGRWRIFVMKFDSTLQVSTNFEYLG